MEMSLPFGVLDQALAALGGPSLATGPSAATARSEQLYRLLRWLESVERGVVILLDDVHWADSDSLGLLSLLCRRIGPLPVAVIATMRTWPKDAREVASSLVGAGVARLVRLAPLTREGSTAMLAERSGRPVSGAAAARGLGAVRRQPAAARAGGVGDRAPARSTPRWPKLAGARA